jgi:hypothetical protein
MRKTDRIYSETFSMNLMPDSIPKILRHPMRNSIHPQQFYIITLQTGDLDDPQGSILKSVATSTYYFENLIPVALKPGSRQIEISFHIVPINCFANEFGKGVSWGMKTPLQEPLTNVKSLFFVNLA